MKAEAGDDAADLFWPGYVDAVVNLVLSLLFVIAVMTMVVFIFALQSRGEKVRPQSDADPTTSTQQAAPSDPSPDTATTPTTAAHPSPSEARLQSQMTELRQQLAALQVEKKALERATQASPSTATQAEAGGATGARKVVEATARYPDSGPVCCRLPKTDPQEGLMPTQN